MRVRLLHANERTPTAYAPMIHLRHVLFLTLLALPAVLSAQSQTGRHFQRSTRLPATPAASAVRDASTSTAHVAPLQKMRSGRAWPRFHFGRLPQPASTGTRGVVDATAQKSPAQKRGFWRAHG